MISDIQVFRKIKPLADAVKLEDVERIQKIAMQHPDWVNFREPIFGETILMWAVQFNKYKSTEKLLELKADPNLQDNDGASSMMFAAACPLGSECLKLLIENGGDVNAVANPKHKEPYVSSYKTPLIASVASYRLENMRLLVDAGADINYQYNDVNHWSALKEAIIHNQIKMVSYLLIEKNANFKNLNYEDIDKRPITICDMLKDWKYVKKTPENNYEILKVFNFLKTKGIDCADQEP